MLGERPQARWLCETASGAFGEDFTEELDRPATERMVAHLDAMVARYRAGEPLQYVLGHWAFRHLDLMVDRRVLIPRPETELVAAVAIERARALSTPVVVADLGTGSGAIGLSMAAELRITGTTVWLTDASADALAVARANAAGVGRAAANVRLAQGSWFDALPDDLRGRLDVVVANPPYIAEDDPEVGSEVREWEPGRGVVRRSRRPRRHPHDRRRGAGVDPARRIAGARDRSPPGRGGAPAAGDRRPRRRRDRPRPGRQGPDRDRSGSCPGVNLPQVRGRAEHHALGALPGERAVAA